MVRIGLDVELELAILGKTDELNELIESKSINIDNINDILLYSAAFGNKSTMMLLDEDYGEYIDWEITDGTRRTLSTIAASYNNLDMVKYLMEISIQMESMKRIFYPPFRASLESLDIDKSEYMLNITNDKHEDKLTEDYSDRYNFSHYITFIIMPGQS